ncbi:MAG: glycosyltransferase [Acidimicrobiales bacterium]
MADFELADLTVNINVVDREDYLLACLQSLLETTPPGPRLNVLFNGSNSGLIERSSELIDRWPGPSSTIVLEETEPLWKSHQAALDSIRTRFVNFMGDDDIIFDERLPRIISAFNELTPTPGAVTTFAKRIGPTIDPIRIGSSKDLGPTTIDEWMALSSEGAMFEMNFSGAVFRTESLHRAGGFAEEFSETADNRLFTVIGATEPVIALPERSFGYRIHPNSVSSSRFLSQAQAVRHVAACARAVVEGLPEPTREEFVAAEEADPRRVRIGRDLSARSQMHFRRGAAEMLQGRPIRGASLVALSAAMSPLRFTRSLRNQIGRRGVET